MKILKIHSLAKGTWTDRDNLILHASFQCLKDCVEKENLFEHSPKYAKSRSGKIAKELYDWWEIRKDKRTSTIDGSYEEDTKQLVRLMKVRGGLWT